MSELDNLFNQYVSGGKAENKPTRAEFKPLILDDDTQDIDANKKDQQTIPQYVDVDKVSEQQFVQPERRSYFVAGNVNNNEINTTAQKPNEIEYEANTIDDEKKKDDYFALTKLSTNKKDIVKNAIKYITGAANPIQSAINTVGAFTGKDDKEIVLEGVRGFTGSTIDFASSLYRFFKQNTDIAKTYTKEQLDKIANLGNVMTGGESFANDIAEQYTEFYKQIDEENKILRDKTERFLQYTGIAKTDKDGFIYDLVGGGASLMYAIGIAAITKSPAAAAEMFGMYQYQSLYEEGIDRGFSPIKARAIGVAGGAFEGGLEMVGLHVLIETLKARRSFTKILKAALTEFTQEASQQGAEETLAKLSGLREDSTVGQIISNVFYAGVIGAILGGGSATVSNVFYKQISDSATRELINNGMQSDYAKQMVDNVLKLSVSPQAAQEVVSISKDEQSPVTYKNADPRETYKETGEAIKKALDPQQKRGVELELIQANKKLTQELANVLLNSGKAKNGDDAYRRAEQVTAMYDMLAREAYNQEGIRPEDYYKRFHVNAQSGNIEIDERNVDEDNPFVDVSFDPVDFDEQARAEYEAAMDAQQEEMDKLQKEFTMSLKDHAKFFRDIGIDAIRRPTPDGAGKDRWGEYKTLSPRIKNYFFSDDPTAMSWDDAEKLLAASSSDIKDLFAYLAKADETAKTYNQKEVFSKVLAKEKEAIKQQAIADGTFLKAPNGKDSNLPEQLWLIVRTKAFKNWFGDWLNDPQNASKVVDENGEPLVVYHGTDKLFRIFNKNKSYQGLFWFSNDYNKVNTGYDGAAGKGIVMPVFLNIKNAADWDLYDKYSPEELENMKYDGLLLKDGNETVAVAFDNKQIKSINNRGSFDKNNPDIYYQPDITRSKTEQLSLQEEQYFANIIQKYNPNIKGDELYEDAKGVQLTFDFEQQANRETVESDVDKNVTDDVTQQETLTTIGNGASYAIWRNGKTGNRLEKLDSVSDIRRIKDSFVGLSITETLIHNGQFSLEGKVVHNPYELAVAAQVLRNPRFETIHAVFVKNDEIVYHFAATTRLAGATQFDIKGMDDLISKTDCDGFYLIHNHPNGDPKPSFADTIFTQQLAKRYGPKFKQHIVIDHNRYRTIDKDGVMSDTDLIIDSAKRDNLLKTSKKHKSLYKKIDPETLPMFAVDLQYGDGKSVVVYVTNKLQAKAIQVVDNSIFDDIDTALEYLSKSGDYAGSGRMFVITDSADVNKQAKFIRKEYTREDKLAGILDVVYSKTKLNKDMVDNKQYETAYDIDRGYFSGRYNNKFFGERKYLYSGRLQNKKSLLKPTFDRGKLIENLSTDILSINPATSYSSLRKLVVAVENFINEKNSKAKDVYRQEINDIYKQENIEQNKTDKIIDRYTELFQQLNDKQGVVLREDAANYFQGNDNPRGATTVYDRQYFIDLFSTSDKSTLLHEGSHGWLSEVLYFANGKNPSPKILAIKKQLDNWLGVPEDNGRYSTRQQELFAGASEVYFMEGKAPTPKLKTVFERFKKWLTDIYDAIKNELPKINDDVRELFDTILSRSYDVPDSNIYAGKEAAIKEVIKNIQEGRASEVDGITIDDVYNLLNVAYTRKPSKPSKNLKQLLNDKNIYDFNELNKAGADTVLQILKDGGYVKEDATAEAAVELAKAALDGKPIYRLADQWRVAGDIDFARNLRVLERVIEFSQIDSTIEKILELQEEGYRNVEQGDVEQVQNDYKRLFSADVKEAKKIVEDIINRLHKKRFIDRAAQKQMIVDLNFSSTVEEIKESVLNVIEDLQDEIKLVKEQLRNPRKPIVRKDKTIPPGKNATEEEKNNYKKYMRRQINKLLKQALPRKQNQQKFSKFDVQTQRFFTDLEKYNKMKIEEAQEELYKRATSIIDDEGVGLDNFEKMKNMFLSYKANKINQNSVEFYKQLYDNLQEINVFGRNAKDIENTLKKEQIQQDINNLVVNIEDNKSKNKVATGVKKQYIKWLGNWWSTINAIAGKKQADKDSLERIEIDIFNKNYETTENLKTKCAAALGLKNATDLDMTVNAYLNTEYTYQEKDARSNTENAVKLNKMQLICCYIWMKNSTLRERIVRAFGNIQIMDMMDKLTIQDKKFGDELQKSVANMYDEVNAVYLKMYGLDMPQAENYFPSSVERIQGNMDLLKDNIGQVSSPGFIKARVQSNLPLMNFGNPVKIALDHIAKVNHFICMQEKLADLNKVYKTTVVKRHITNAYGDRVYDYILQVLDNAKFTTVAKTIDGISDIGNYLVNNYVLTKIAVKPSIMMKQLLSCINYAEDMSAVKWFEGFLKGVASPKKVIDFMMKNSKYCQSRFAKGGQSEALLKAMEGSNATFAKVKTFKGMLSWMTRVGDIGAIMFGGYPYVMDQMSKGVPLKTAVENFERATIRSQQASLPSTLSNFQYRGMNSWLYRAMFAFANTPNQYSRKMGDAVYMYMHGDIDKKQLAKTLVIYGVLNPILYSSFTSLAILSGLVSGDWDDLKDDIIMSLFQTSNVLSLPLFSIVYNNIVAWRVTGKYLPDKQIPLLDDMLKVMKTVTKEDIEMKDWLTVVDEVASLVFGVPVKTLYNTFVGSTKDLLDGEYGKFAVKLYGATESRANKIFD